MLSAATRVLRLAFVPSPPLEGRPDDDSLIDFVAYARDFTLTGSLRLEVDRLSDLLNTSDELELIDVIRLGLDGRIIESDHATISRRDLLAVKAGDPRGNPALRHRTRQFAVAAGAGVYTMHGYIHGLPGADPMTHLSRRPPMVPLTDATIGYTTARGGRFDHASTLIVNRDAADWVRPAREDELGRLRAGSGAT
jgi:hypothetical protein